jgi:hypothetical protein
MFLSVDINQQTGSVFLSSFWITSHDDQTVFEVSSDSKHNSFVLANSASLNKLTYGSLVYYLGVSQVRNAKLAQKCKFHFVIHAVDFHVMNACCMLPG